MTDIEIAASEAVTAARSDAVGGGKIAQAELETQAATKLAETVDNGVTPNISCPGDLDAEVGAKITCELTVDGEETILPVYIEVTEANDVVANFDVEVGQP